MTSPAYAVEIQNALAFPRSQDTAEGVKAVVAREIEAADTSVRVRATEYFNHSFMPDLVLEWPHSPGVQPRFVYIKFTGDREYFVRDVELVEEREPIVFGIGDDETQETLAADLEAANTLLTDPYGLATVIDETGSSPAVRLISAALTQDGRGVLDASNATALTRGFSRGLEGARALRANETLQASALLAVFFRDRQSHRLRQFLQALWIGSGGHAGLFADAVAQDSAADGSDFSDEALEFLLALEEIEDPTFWRRIGRKATIERLARLTVDGTSRNLQRYVTHNLDVRWARAYRLAGAAGDGSPGPDVLSWAVEDGALALRADDFVAYFDASVEELRKKVPGSSVKGISLADLRERAHGIPVRELTVGSASRTVTYEAENRDDIAGDAGLDALTDALGQDARISRVSVPISGKRAVVCDLTTRTASCRGSAKVSLAELLGTLPLLHTLSEEQKQDLRRLLRGLVPERAAAPVR
jgi:hypothetical protein